MLFWALLLRGKVGDDSSYFGGAYHFGEVGFGFYWSSTPVDEHSAYNMYFYTNYLNAWYFDSRIVGFSVRPVLDN